MWSETGGTLISILKQNRKTQFHVWWHSQSEAGKNKHWAQAEGEFLGKWNMLSFLTRLWLLPFPVSARALSRSFSVVCLWRCCTRNVGHYKEISKWSRQLLNASAATSWWYLVYQFTFKMLLHDVTLHTLTLAQMGGCTQVRQAKLQAVAECGTHMKRACIKLQKSTRV